jgi:hypothetical protein
LQFHILYIKREDIFQGFLDFLYFVVMTVYEFSLLNKNDQAKEIWNGEFVTYRELKAFTIVLHKVHDFYVEVIYNSEDPYH